MVERGRPCRWHFRVAHRGSRGIWPVLGSLPAHCSWKTVRLENGTGVFSDHVRDDGALLCLRRLFRSPDHERIAAAASSDF